MRVDLKKNRPEFFGKDVCTADKIQEKRWQN